MKTPEKQRDMSKFPASCREETCPACRGTGRVPDDYPIPETAMSDRGCCRCGSYGTLVIWADRDRR